MKLATKLVMQGNIPKLRKHKLKYLGIRAMVHRPYLPKVTHAVHEW